MAEINDLEIVDDDNTARFPEGQAPSTVNNGARQLEGIVARWHKDTNASKSSTGSANAYIFAADQTLTAYYDGLEIAFDANFTNDGAATLDVDGIGAQSIVLVDGSALTGSEIVSGQKAVVIYDGANWQLLNPSFTGLKSLPVGSTIPYVGTVAPSGFVLAEGRTIGNAASGASERAADDTKALFELIWNSTTDANAPVTPGGRGTDAESDFNANKTITLPDLRGRSVIGQGTGPDTADGGTAGEARANFEKGGAESYVLTTGQLPSGLQVYDGGSLLVGTDGSLTTAASPTRIAAGSDDPIDQMHPWQALTNIISLGAGLTNGVGEGGRDASGDTVTAAGSTTGRTAGNRAAESYHVKDWGAVGDGVTDDSAAIIQAIADIVAGGVKTVLRFGDSKNTTYKCDSALGTIDASIVSFDGPATLDFTALTTGTAVTITSSLSLFLNVLSSLDRITWKGPGKTSGVGLFGFSSIGGSGGGSRLSFRDNVFQDWQDIVTWGDDTANTYWENNLFRNYERAIYIPSGLTNAGSGETFQRNRFTGGGLAFDLNTQCVVKVFGGNMDGSRAVRGTQGRIEFSGTNLEELDGQKWTDPPIWISGSGTQVIWNAGQIQSSSGTPASDISCIFRNDADQTDPARIQINDARVDVFSTFQGYLAEGPGNVALNRRYDLTLQNNKKFLGYQHNTINRGDFFGLGVNDLYSVKSGTEGATATDRLNTTNLDIFSNTGAVRNVDFNGNTDVDTVLNQITLPSDNGYYRGKPISYDNGGNANIAPLISGTTYYAIMVSSTVIKLAASLADAVAGTEISLTSASTGTHSFKSNLRGLRLDWKAGTPSMVIAKPIRPNQAATARIYHRLQAAGSWTFSMYYALTAFDANGLLEIIDQAADIESASLSDTTWTQRNAERVQPCPHNFNSVVLEFALTNADLNLDDLLLDVQ